MKESAVCSGCGREVRRVKCLDGHIYRVDPEPVWIMLRSGGNPFLRITGGRGSMVYGMQIGDAYDTEDPDSELIEAYCFHEYWCPKGGRSRRGRFAK